MRNEMDSGFIYLPLAQSFVTVRNTNPKPQHHHPFHRINCDRSPGCYTNFIAIPAVDDLIRETTAVEYSNLGYGLGAETAGVAFGDDEDGTVP